MVDFHSEGKGADRFLITGCQRSGTTLVAMALEAHPLIEIVEENDARFHIQGRATRELDLEAASGQVASDRRMIGYKAPRDSHRVDEVARCFPLVRILWVERELRQVISSMLALNSTRGSWAATFAPREISKHISKTEDERARRLFVLTSEVENQAARSAAFASLCWLVKREQRHLATRLLGPRVLRVDYDDLVTNPSSVLRGVLDFLQLPWSPLVLDHPASIANVTRPGQADSSRPIDAFSRSKWKTRLSHRDLAIMDSIKRCFERNEEPNDLARTACVSKSFSEFCKESLRGQGHSGKSNRHTGKDLRHHRP